MNRYIWSAVGIVALAYVLMAFVKAAMPLLIVAAVLIAGYKWLFQRRM